MLSLERQNDFRELFRQANPGWRPATEIYASITRRFLQPDSRVLDLGCGRGGTLEQLGPTPATVVGLDADLESLRTHRLVDQGSSFLRVASLNRHLPFSPGSFDLVIASWLLEHLECPEEDFEQIGRVLSPRGVFVFVTPNDRHPLTQLNRLVGRIGRLQQPLVKWFYSRDAADTFPAHYRANNEDELRRLALNGRMRLAHLEIIADPTYLAFTPILFHLSCWLEARLPAGRGIHLVGWMQRASSEE